MAPRSRYKEGESVLAFQGVLIYEAKVLGVVRQGTGFVYDIHYKGWNKTWDEQVLEDRLLKLTDENLTKQREAVEEVRAKKAARPGLQKPGIALKDSSEAISNSVEEEPEKPEVVPASSSVPSSSCVNEDQTKPTKIATIRILKEGAVKPSIEGPPKLVRSTSRNAKEIPIKTINETLPKNVKEITSIKARETVSKSNLETAPVSTKKSASKRKKGTAAAAKSAKRPYYESVEVRLEVIPKVKKTRSRSNSDASVISVHSTKSSDGSKSIKTRPIKPKAVLKSATEVPKAMKKVKKKTKVKEIPLSPAKPSKIIKSKASIKLEGAVQQTKTKLFGSAVEITLSEDLKIILVDDLDYIGRQRKLQNIPSRYNVDDSIEDYLTWLRRRQTDSASKLSEAEEVCKGLRDYFNSTLGSLLLYKFERVQYADLLKDHPGVPMSELYGPVHLLRLLTKLGPMICSVPLGQEAIDKLVGQVNKFIEYLTRHREDLFRRQDYGTATPEYHRRAL